MNKNQIKILVIDIKTTNSLNNKGKIVEVGMVELNLSNGKIKTIFSEVCHEKEITKKDCENSWIVKNSTLTVELIRKSRRFDIIKPEIQKIINTYPLGCTMYNNVFDFCFLVDRSFVFIKKLPCPMILSTNILKLPPKTGKTGYKWPNLDEAYNYFFPEERYTELHRAADDAFHGAKIIYQLCKLGVYKLETISQPWI